MWTVEDLLALPDDGVRRWIIDGQLREQPSPYDNGVFVRSRAEAHTLANIGTSVLGWEKARPRPHGGVFGGDVGVVLAREPDTVIGVALAYASPDLVAAQDDEKTSLLDGVPTLVVEVLSPNDSFVLLKEKLQKYLKAGVPLVWHVDPDERSVTVYQHGVSPVLFNVPDRIPEHPAMPGFAPAVAELFE